MNNDFRKYAVGHLGMNGLALDEYAKFTDSYIFSKHIGGTSAQCYTDGCGSPV